MGTPLRWDYINMGHHPFVIVYGDAPRDDKHIEIIMYGDVLMRPEHQTTSCVKQMWKKTSQKSQIHQQHQQKDTKIMVLRVEEHEHEGKQQDLSQLQNGTGLGECNPPTLEPFGNWTISFYTLYWT